MVLPARRPAPGPPGEAPAAPPRPVAGPPPPGHRPPARRQANGASAGGPEGLSFGSSWRRGARHARLPRSRRSTTSPWPPAGRYPHRVTSHLRLASARTGHRSSTHEDPTTDPGHLRRAAPQAPANSGPAHTGCPRPEGTAPMRLRAVRGPQRSVRAERTIATSAVGGGAEAAGLPRGDRTAGTPHPAVSRRVLAASPMSSRCGTHRAPQVSRKPWARTHSAETAQARAGGRPKRTCPSIVRSPPGHAHVAQQTTQAHAAAAAETYLPLNRPQPPGSRPCTPTSTHPRRATGQPRALGPDPPLRRDRAGTRRRGGSGARGPRRLGRQSSAASRAALV
jgi:hypothetical protein